MEIAKPWYLSKTILVNVLAGLAMILAGFQPGIAAFIQENFSAVGGGWAIVNVALRIITKQEIS